VAIIYLGSKGLLRNIPVEKITEFEGLFLSSIEQQIPEVLENFRVGKLEKEDLEKVETIAADLSKQFG